MIQITFTGGSTLNH